MITLTEKEWKNNKDKWAESKPIGTRVIVYGHPIHYNKKTSPISVYGKFELREGGTWARL